MKIYGNLKFYGELTVAKPIKMTPGYQETGDCGFGSYLDVGGTGVGIRVPFRHRMSNIPSSITLSVSTSSNVRSGSLSAGIITIDGFQLNFTVNNAGDSYWRGTYTTVGN
jgi:hypothetical protein